MSRYCIWFFSSLRRCQLLRAWLLSRLMALSVLQETQDDSIVAGHVAALYAKLLEQNLTRVVEPFSRVEVAHIADIMSLGVEVVERKLSQVRWGRCLE